MTQRPTVVWTEIPVTDLEAATEFYQSVFDWTMVRDDSAANPLVNFSSDMQGVGGHLYPGQPAAAGTGPSLHLAVADTVEDAAERVKAKGGSVVGPVITIPPGRFQYAVDPDGNSIGLFEPAG